MLRLGWLGVGVVIVGVVVVVGVGGVVVVGVVVVGLLTVGLLGLGVVILGLLGVGVGVVAHCAAVLRCFVTVHNSLTINPFLSGDNVAAISNSRSAATALPFCAYA